MSKAKKKTKPSTSAAKSESGGSSPKQSKPKPVDGVELARLRRLERAGYDVDRCALLGVKLDVGPRSIRWHHPRRLGDALVSELGAFVIESGVSPEALERAAKMLRKRGES